MMFMFSLFKLPCMSYGFERVFVLVCTVKYVSVYVCILLPEDVKYMVILKEENHSIRNLIESQESSALHFTTMNIVPSTYDFIKSTEFSFIYTAKPAADLKFMDDGWMDVWTSLSRNSYFSVTKMRTKQAVLFFSYRKMFVKIIGDRFTKVEINEWAAAFICV